MKKVKTLILRTAGTNCDLETAFAFKAAGAEAELMHINEVIKKKSILNKFQILAIPGGFTYGDDVASGKILANEIKFYLKSQISKFTKDGKFIIGICNGFQVLVKMGILPNLNNSKTHKMESTLSLNDSGKFNAKWVYLKSSKESRQKCLWAKDLPEVVYVPIAHAEGKFIPKDDTVLKALKKNKQIVFRYSDKDGEIAPYPHNPNGSIDNIAGICDSTGRILGMMPHPERHITYLQHPNWRRRSADEQDMGVGFKVFANGVMAAEKLL